MFRKKMHVKGRLRWWDRSVAKTVGLRGVCTKDQEIEIYRTLYAKAAKERDEAVAENRKLREALFLRDCNFEL